MKKQLRFLYRYYITTRHWRRLLNRQILIVLAATAVFLTTLAWTSPNVTDREQPRAPQQPGRAGAAMQVSAGLTQLTPEPEAAPTAAGDGGAANGEAIRVEPTNTPFPPEFYENADQTIGITLAGALLVVIVVLGVLTLMPRKK